MKKIEEVKESSSRQEIVNMIEQCLKPRGFWPLYPHIRSQLGNFIEEKTSEISFDLGLSYTILVSKDKV